MLRRLLIIHDDFDRGEAASSNGPKELVGRRRDLPRREPNVGRPDIEVGQYPLDARQPDERVLDVGHSPGAGQALNVDDCVGSGYLRYRRVDAARVRCRAADEARDDSDDSKPVKQSLPHRVYSGNEGLRR